MSPDIICIVETWLSPDISDSEVSLPHNLCFRYDRDRHGGSVAVYVKSSLSASVLPSPVNLELILLSIKFNQYHFTLSNFYHPPNRNQDLDVLIEFFSSLDLNLFHNFFLVGDFNIDFNKSSNSRLKLLDFSESLGLHQIISEPTHFAHSGSPSTIDLIFAPI